MKLKSYVVTSGSYDPSGLTDIDIVLCDTSSGAVSVVIPTEDIKSGTVVKPRLIKVSDYTGNASVNNITVSLENGGTINGSSALVISGDYNSIDLILDGTNGRVT